MKVVRLVSELDFGGVEKVVELAALEFLKIKEVEMHVVVLSHGGKVSEFLRRRGVRVSVLNKKAKIPNLFLIFHLVRLFKSLKIDIVHTSGAEANFHGMWAAFLAGVKVRIAEEIGYPNHHLIWEYVFKCTYGLSHSVIVISQAVQKFIVRKGEVAVDKTLVIYNPVQIFDKISRNPDLKERFEFIVVARMVHIKNLESCLKAFHLVEHDHKYLTLVGEGPEKLKLELLARDLGIQHRVKFLGYQENVSRSLARADCFVLPSFSEGSSLALAEAMCAGLPSIVTKIGGAVEVLGDSDSGILVDPHNLREIKEAMVAILNLNVSDRLEMGTRAREYVIQNFSPPKHAGHLQTLYKERLEEN